MSIEFDFASKIDSNLKLEATTIVVLGSRHDFYTHKQLRIQLALN